MKSAQKITEQRNKSLHIACEQGNLPLVELLLQQQNIDVNSYAESNYTPLHIACQLDDNINVKIIELLISKGANIDAEAAFEVTLLSIVCDDRDLSIVKLFIAKGAEIRLIKDNVKNYKAEIKNYIEGVVEQNSKIINALSDNMLNFKEFKELFSKNLDVQIKAKNEKGNSLLHIACYNANQEVAEFLIRQGANLLTKDQDGKTPLNYYNRVSSNENIRNLYCAHLINGCIGINQKQSAQAIIILCAKNITYPHSANSLNP